jgi:hypothetical protein
MRIFGYLTLHRRNVGIRILARLSAYFAAGVTSSAAFTSWVAFGELRGPLGQQLDPLNVTSEALRLWPYVLVIALLLMFLPWCLMMWSSRWMPFRGSVWYAGSTAVAALFAFGSFAGFFPARGHPTFLQGFVLAVETSGFPVLVSGAVGGLIYWLVRERDERLNQMRSVAQNGGNSPAH